MSDSTPDGPVEAGPWPDRLAARVVSPGPQPRVRGYDLQADLLRNYSFVEVAWLAISGELPSSKEQTAALELVLGHLFPVRANEGPAHAAGLTRLCDSNPASVVAVAAVTLAEEGRAALREHEALWGWLDDSGPWPEQLCARDAAERATVAALAVELERRGVSSPVFDKAPRVETACLAVLHGWGLRDPEPLLSLWVWSRLPCALAEAFAVPPRRLADYPMNVPAYRYEASDD